jgi:hypothetical protein
MGRGSRKSSRQMGPVENSFLSRDSKRVFARNLGKLTDGNNDDSGEWEAFSLMFCGQQNLKNRKKYEGKYLMICMFTNITMYY